MANKKLVQSVKIYLGLLGEEDPKEYTVGKDDVVAIGFDRNMVEIYFRAAEGVKPEDRPYKFYSGFKFIASEL